MLVQQGNYRDSSLAYKKKRHRLSSIDTRQSHGVKNGVGGNSLRVGFALAAKVIDQSAPRRDLNKGAAYF